jgi:hypothetical protein
MVFFKIILFKIFIYIKMSNSIKYKILNEMLEFFQQNYNEEEYTKIYEYVKKFDDHKTEIKKQKNRDNFKRYYEKNKDKIKSKKSNSTDN